MTNEVQSAVQTTATPTQAASVPGTWGPPVFRSVERWDSGSGAGIPQEALEAVVACHRPLARSLSRSLSVYLRAVAEVELAAAQEVLYSQFAESLTPAALTSALRLDTQPSPVIIVLDAALTSPCLDLLLGGSGENPLERSELSDVDVQVLSELIRLVSQDLSATWQDLELRFQPEVAIGKAARRAIPQSGRAMALNFTVKLGEKTGFLQLVLNASLVETMRQILNIPVRSAPSPSDGVMSPGLQQAMSEISVAAELVLPPLRVPIRELVQLAPNSVLTLPLRADQPAHLVVEGRNLFSALPARSGSWRAARLNRMMPSGATQSEGNERS